MMAHPLAAELPELMIVANAVAVLPTSTDRLDGNTAATRGLAPPGLTAGSAKRAMIPKPSELLSMNHSAPSGPTVTSKGGKVRVIGYSVTLPPVVMRPIRNPVVLFCSVNHRAPSGPTVRPQGALLAEGVANSVMTPPVVMRPILPFKVSVNHSAPSGPATMVCGALLLAGGPSPLPVVPSGYKVMLPPVVIRPIWLPKFSVNHTPHPIPP